KEDREHKISVAAHIAWPFENDLRSGLFRALEQPVARPHGKFDFQRHGGGVGELGDDPVSRDDLEAPDLAGVERREQRAVVGLLGGRFRPPREKRNQQRDDNRGEIDQRRGRMRSVLSESDSRRAEGSSQGMHMSGNEGPNARYSQMVREGWQCQQAVWPSAIMDGCPVERWRPSTDAATAAGGWRGRASGV